MSYNVIFLGIFEEANVSDAANVDVVVIFGVIFMLYQILGLKISPYLKMDWLF